MKKTVFIAAVLMVTAFASHAQIRISADVIFGRRAPNPTEMNAMRAEEMKYPNVAKAMHNVEEAINLLHSAPSIFGGHKGDAEASLRKSLVSLRKALYYRLYQDRR